MLIEQLGQKYGKSCPFIFSKISPLKLKLNGVIWSNVPASKISNYRFDANSFSIDSTFISRSK